MQKIPRKIIQTSLAIFIGVFIAISASYISALTSRPGDINTNAPNTIDVGTTNQTKGDPLNPDGGQLSLKSLIAGHVTSVNFSRINDLGYMSLGRLAPGSGIALDIKGKDGGAKGTIRALRLAHTADAKVPLCATANGRLELCGENLEFNATKDTNGNYESSIYSLVIPPGVSYLNVTVLGAGGAGYGEDNIGTYGDDGDDSFFAGKDVTLLANGGKGADSFKNTISGGEAIATPSSTNSRVTALGLHNGGNGETRSYSYVGSSSVVTTGTCSGATYYLVQGGAGDTGGKGGASYVGAQVSGGVGSSGGPLSGYQWDFNSLTWPYIDCNLIITSSDDHQTNSSEDNNRIGGNGVDGGLGDGGSGFGGQGGASALADTSDCSIFTNPYLCKGQKSGSGGGAGAYITSTIKVNEGEVFYIKVGRGGVPQYTACSGSYADIMTCKKNKEAGGGAVSGKGGNGKVTVQFDYNS